ncbi:hypothetical protein [Nitrospira moscoviensis]|uniref:Uncharacterized protein n=1 Tax=Nitrospira moscoviensis TaxID=42253 RepID=A0A0K2G9P9_NITMO|nr:hypothetical protein [Nitrospira moscoviensis]ALA57678.1 hypothetical protein NITMOv2_1250 [Nitrospira moscoviensis]
MVRAESAGEAFDCVAMPAWFRHRERSQGFIVDDEGGVEKNGKRFSGDRVMSTPYHC